MSNLDCCGPFDSYHEFSSLCPDQLTDKLLKGFHLPSYTGELEFLPLYRKSAPLEVNKMRYSHVFFKMYRNTWRNTRNSLYMGALKVPDRPRPIYLQNDDLSSRRSTVVYDINSKFVAYAVDKLHPCDYCIIVASRHAYVRLLLILYNENYSMKEYKHIRVLYWAAGRFCERADSPFWDLVKEDKHIAMFFDTFAVDIHHPEYIDIAGHNTSTIDILKTGEELSDLLKCLK